MSAILTDLTVLGVFLLLGMVIRQIVKPLQKIFLASSIIGGLLLLALGPQCLDLVAVPESFSGYSGAMIRFIMCALVFGTDISRNKLESYGDYMMVVHSVYGWQMALGLGLGVVMCKIWLSARRLGLPGRSGLLRRPRHRCRCRRRVPGGYRSG